MTITEQIERMTFDMLKEAIKEYGDAITPVGRPGKKSWKECYTIENGELVLYFNLPSGTTRTMRRKI